MNSNSLVSYLNLSNALSEARRVRNITIALKIILAVGAAWGIVHFGIGFWEILLLILTVVFA